MIIFGKKRSRITVQELHSLHCADCKKNTTMNFHVFGIYAHIFWIPMFPLGKQVISECLDCKGAKMDKEMPTLLKETGNNIKSKTKYPFF